MCRFLVVLLPLFFSALSGVSLARSYSVSRAKVGDFKDNFSILLYDLEKKRVLLQESAQKQVVPASLLKLMSLYVVFSDIASRKISIDDIVKISKAAVVQPKNKIGFVEGQEVCLGDLILAVGVASANDAAHAVAEFAGNGDVCGFVERMNFYAKKIGMKNTFFVNPTGLNSNYCKNGSIQKNENDQVLAKRFFGKTVSTTTPEDMLKLTVKIFEEFPGMIDFFHRPEFELNGKVYRITNNVAFHMRNARGIKTGFTNMSGYNIIGQLNDGPNKIIAVVTGVGSESLRDLCMEYLLSYGANLVNGIGAKSTAKTTKSLCLTSDCDTKGDNFVDPVVFCRGYGKIPFSALNGNASPLKS